jgi:ABC-2 type transport system ATP-binding protein
MAILTVRHLTKTFTSGWWPFAQTSYNAVNDISFQINKGEILGLLGPNGAGKTTTIQMLLGTLTPTRGSISYFGNDFTHHRIDILQRVGYASGYDRLPARLTVMENLDIVGRIYNIPHKQRSEQIETLLKFFGVWDARNHQTGTLSAGQTTRVMLAKTFLAHPDIVLLDEPTASLDPDIAYEVRQFILAQREHRGVALIITSHNMAEVTELCDRVLVLKQGSIVADSTPAELARSAKNVRLQLTITHNFEHALAYFHTTRIIHTIKDNNVTLEMDEHAIAPFLANVGAQNIVYSHISIDKPTLEDYFLSIAKQQRIL